MSAPSWAAAASNADPHLKVTELLQHDQPRPAARAPRPAIYSAFRTPSGSPGVTWTAPGSSQGSANASPADPVVMLSRHHLLLTLYGGLSGETRSRPYLKPLAAPGQYRESRTRALTRQPAPLPAQKWHVGATSCLGHTAWPHAPVGDQESPSGPNL